ncbi:MAG TPA: DUF3618 domain-containing protein [Polyangiales bacterium]|nr:DUF3618 domain-containing protein [Polyangiales bacterium]
MTPTQDKDKENKSSKELEKDVQQTRSAITSDIQSLSDKLSPSHLKEEAKGAVVNAAQNAADKAVDKAVEVKDVIVDKAAEVKDAVVDKALEVKDVASEKLSEAKETVVETMENVGEEARRIGGATWRFTAANAVPLALIGVGAGWMIANQRRTNGQRTATYAREDYYEDDLARPTGYATTSRTRRGLSGEWPGERSSAYREPHAQRPAARAAMSRASERATDLAHSARETGEKLAERASRGAERMKEGLRRAGERTRTFADENPLAIAMAALVAGIGVGMALPSTDRERRMLRPAHDKLDEWMGEARGAAKEVAQAAKDTASESYHALT